jgi:hypothetical protein
MVNSLIAAAIIILALCGGLVVFRIEARQHKPRVLDPGSYRFGMFGMVVYFLMYAVVTVIEKVCLMVGMAPRLRLDDDFIDDYYIVNILHDDK